jgi:hypothetical protein
MAGLEAMPDCWLTQMCSAHLKAASRLSLRATCRHLLHICSSWEQAGAVAGRSQQHSPAAPSRLVLRLDRRQPSIAVLHGLGLLQHVVVLDTSAAKRGVLSIGPMSPPGCAGALPALRRAAINSSQSSLAELLATAAPRLSELQLSVCSSTPAVLRHVAQVCLPRTPTSAVR